MKNRFFEITSKIYSALASVIALGVVVFLLINLSLMAVFYFRDRAVRKQQEISALDWQKEREGKPAFTKKRNGYQMAWVDLRSYEEVDPDKVSKVLDDFFDFQLAGVAFRPYVHFSDPIFQGNTLRVESFSQGIEYRRNDPDFVLPQTEELIYIFGGSTVFGWNVADEWTIPSYLEKVLNQKDKSNKPIKVINFGRTNYSWFQELVLFERLLLLGHRPKVVIFLDGVNVFNVQGALQIPKWTETLEKMLPANKPTTEQPGFYAVAQFLPIHRFIHFLRTPKKVEQEEVETISEVPQEIKESYLHTMRQIKALARLYSIKPVFIWQPNRAYRCDTEKYSQPLPDSYTLPMQRLYEEMEATKVEGFYPMGSLCEQMGKEHRVFVDDLHYSPLFNKFIAQQISERVSLN